MKKMTLVVLMLLLLTGCSQPVWETVDDAYQDVPAASWLENTYTIVTALPQDVTLLERTEGWCVYSNADGSIEVETRTFPASDFAAAAKMISGYDAQKLNVLQTERFGLPEYQFAWVTQTECGQRLCRADLVLDETDCYAVICSTLEEVGDVYAEDIRQVISAFGLYVDEGV